MKLNAVFIVCLLIFFGGFLYAQKGVGKLYRIDRYESVYLPLGKISFADSVVSFRLGDPGPLQKYTDETQALHEPNYTRYSEPNFVSLGCNGCLTVAFTDNGFMNLPGKDLYIFEVGPSREAAKVEISEDGVTWLYAGKIAGGKSSIELSDQNISTEIVFNYLRITDLKEVCKSKSAGADIDAIGAINSVIKLTINADVLFDVAEFTLIESAHKTLDSLTKTIQQVDKATILVEGHTDSDGADDYNMKLSENRCYSVVDRIRGLLGYEALYDYEIKALGETKPRVENDTPENKQINRRVEITVLPPKEYYKILQKKN
ncbi:outer membrane protein OmpA-like peptidoglycan-associated protein [Ulvibacter sp. MAR_2010_11]|uniref:OmpA family protein n=1 Tax=Ulvibacter sp. MAR_2010_11 TaxID=1250229 RepID=UPI000C2C1D2B|nr:OmpA family protein [Ulvibacter sp. MAR_2010_11]PKA81933.1 outer membrane protein OmpA-like peptidoglycan-associated protein [Ulvibacter sp. MAR_2010_11]